MKNPYAVIKKRHVTEKSGVLGNLQNAIGNPSLERCKAPKYTFLVDRRANKHEIAEAVEAIYAEKNVKVKAVNTLIVKPKQKARRRGKGRPGATAAVKKAIVTFDEGDALDNV